MVAPTLPLRLGLWTLSANCRLRIVHRVLVWIRWETGLLLFHTIGPSMVHTGIHRDLPRSYKADSEGRNSGCDLVRDSATGIGNSKNCRSREVHAKGMPSAACAGLLGNVCSMARAMGNCRYSSYLRKQAVSEEDKAETRHHDLLPQAAYSQGLAAVWEEAAGAASEAVRSARPAAGAEHLELVEHRTNSEACHTMFQAVRSESSGSSIWRGARRVLGSPGKAQRIGWDPAKRR